MTVQRIVHRFHCALCCVVIIVLILATAAAVPLNTGDVSAINKRFNMNISVHNSVPLLSPLLLLHILVLIHPVFHNVYIYFEKPRWGRVATTTKHTTKVGASGPHIQFSSENDAGAAGNPTWRKGG